jgi:hypothetical protein
MIFSENRLPLFRIMLCPNPPGANDCRFHRRAPGAAVSASARALFCTAWEARPKPRPASPANMSKRGLSARLYASNQTLIMVNTRLPKGILTAGNGIGRTSIRALCRSRGAARGWAQAWAITIEHGVAFSRQDLPEACVSLSLQREGAGNAGCALHPRSRVQTAQKKAHTSIQGSGGNPTFPAQWLYGLYRAHPGESGLVVPVACG